MENNTVKIVPSTLKAQVEEGKKLDDLCSFYNLPKSQMKKALQQLGLKIRKFHKPKFEFVLEDEDIQAIDEELVGNSEDIIACEDNQDVIVSDTEDIIVYENKEEETTGQLVSNW